MPSGLHLTSQQKELMKDNVQPKAQGLRFISLHEWVAQSQAAPHNLASADSPTEQAGSPPQAAAGRELYHKAVAETVSANRHLLASCFTAQQEPQHWIYPSQQPQANTAS